MTRIRANLPRSIDEPMIQRVDIAGLADSHLCRDSARQDARAALVVRRGRGDPRAARVRGVGPASNASEASSARSGSASTRFGCKAVGLTPLDVSRQLRGQQRRSSPAGGPRSAAATRRSAPSPEPRRSPISAATRIALPAGGEVRLDDLGLITDTIAEPRTFARFDGAPVVGFNILRAKGASDVVLADAVAARIDAIKAGQPRRRPQADRHLGRFTRSETTDPAMHTLYEGAILAVIVVFLFLRDWRATIIAALTLPLCRSFRPSGSWNCSASRCNMVTLLAITLSTGILVDDAIVEIENIVRHIRMGKSPYQAALEAADEIGLAVIAISLAIVAVFMPRELYAFGSGQFFKQFGITVSVQVLFSLLCARMITPMLAAYFLRPHQHEEKGDGPTMRLYTRLVTGAVRYRFITVVLGLLLLRCVSAGACAALPSGFLPDHGYGPLDARHRAASRFAAFGHGSRDRYHRQSGAQAAEVAERLRRRRTNSERRRRCQHGPD